MPVAGLENANLVIVEVDDVSGIADQSAGIARQESFAFADAQHQRATQTRAHQDAGLNGADHRQAIGPLQLRQDQCNRFGQIILQVMGDEMRNDFGIGVAEEHVAEFLQFSAQRSVVFDDAVMRDSDFAIAAYVRVRIAVRRRAVRGPACVPDAGRALGWIVFEIGRQVGDAAEAFPDCQISVERRNAGAVIAAVFESAQAFEEKGFRFVKTGVTDNSTHIGETSSHWTAQGCATGYRAYPTDIAAWMPIVPGFRLVYHKFNT